jgi:hypothetical protein
MVKGSKLSNLSDVTILKHSSTTQWEIAENFPGKAKDYPTIAG